MDGVCLNALSVVGVAWVLWRWRPAPSVQRCHQSTSSPAVRSGIRYVRRAGAAQRAGAHRAFFVFGSAGWALLPLVARHELGTGPAGYGVMLACIGLGAIAGAILLPRLRQRLCRPSDGSREARSLPLTMALRLCAVWLLNLFEFLPVSWIAGALDPQPRRAAGAARWVKARTGGVPDGVLRLDDRRQRHLGQILSSAPPTSLVVATLGMVLASATAFRWKLEKDLI